MWVIGPGVIYAQKVAGFAAKAAAKWRQLAVGKQKTAECFGDGAPIGIFGEMGKVGPGLTGQNVVATVSGKNDARMSGNLLSLFSARGEKWRDCRLRRGVRHFRLLTPR